MESVKRILCPLDPSRYYELPKVANALRLKRKSCVLDISSPKLLVYYLAVRFPEVEFVSIDKYEEELMNWKELVKAPKNMKILLDDAMKLKFQDEYFDEVFSVSVIEHVNTGKDEGDGAMAKEVYRVLKKGGRFVFTTVISNRYRLEYRSSGIYTKNKKKKKSFFARIYSYKKLKERVLDAAPYKIISEQVCNYNHVWHERVFNKLVPYSVIYGLVHIFIAPLMINETSTNKINTRADYFAVMEKV